MSPDVKRVLAARGLRAFGDGTISLLLPVYLTALGFTPFRVGLLATATLLGSAAVTLLVGVISHRFTRRGLLLGATVLMAATGLAFALVTAFWPLVLVAFVGTLNPSSGDVSLFLPLEQATLSHCTSDRERTRVFAWYSLTGSLVGAAGALFAGLPELLVARAGLGLVPVLQGMFLLYALSGVVSFLVFRRLSPAVEGRPLLNQEGAQGAPAVEGRPLLNQEGAQGAPAVEGRPLLNQEGAQGAPAVEGDEEKPSQPLGPSRRIVLVLAALFSLDAFGGGFFVQSLLALWLFERFGLSLGLAATVFFWTGVLSALSYLVAVPIARRIGLVNTMVFTHLPSNLCLMLVPLMPGLVPALALLFLRSALSQMDVPTRSSYVMAVVTPPERAAAASLTAVPRSLAAALSPFIAGYLLSLSSFGWPLLAGGLLKAIYDLLLLALFRRHRPPEEAETVPRPVSSASAGRVP